MINTGISDEIIVDNSPLTANYMPRPRLDEILDRATSCKLVYVVASAGYGKTQGVYHYIKQQPNAVVRWIQLTENDNVGSHYWESLIFNVAQDNPDLAVKLRELGFPDTLARFKQFAEIQRTAEHSSLKTYLVLDDFHLIHCKQSMTFAERCAHLDIPGACVIIISRKEPEINAISLFSKGKASMVTEDELRFTEQEIADLLRYRDIPFTQADLPGFYEVTKGWAMAIKLLSLVLKRNPKNIPYAMQTMRQKVFVLLGTEAWDDFPSDVQKKLVQLSLISDLPLVPLGGFFEQLDVIQDTPGLESFIWFDSFAGDYRIHPLYLEFLQSKQQILSQNEIQDTYRAAAEWCVQNDIFLDAMKYYALSHQYKRMLELLLSYPFKMPPDTCEYLLDILENMNPDQEQQESHSVLLLRHFFIPLLLMGMNRFNDAVERCMGTIDEWEQQQTPIANYLLYCAYSNLAYIDTYTCTVTHKYNFADYLEMAVQYYKQSGMHPLKSTGAFNTADIRSYACLMGEGAQRDEIDNYLQATRQAELAIVETPHSMYYGYADLLECELAFFRNQPEAAKNFAYDAIFKAREKNQYSIEAMAEQYLLRIAAQEGDSQLASRILKQMSDHLDNKDFWNRQLLYDLFTGSFYPQIGLPEMAPAWFAMDEKETASEVRILARELIVIARYFIASKQYDQAITVLSKSYPRDLQERFLFGELMFSLLAAVARVKTGNAKGAVADFERAYQMSFCGEFDMFFIEMGRHIHPLIAAALKDPDCTIPQEWLKATDQKAYIYTKKADIIRNMIKRQRNIKDQIQLSDREREVLSDLYHGLSREEIATNRYLSINTVKKILQSVYIKLDANNNVDAIRIAMEKKLVE